MYDRTRKVPGFGTTDWAAQQFLRMLDREEREKAELRRLEAANRRRALTRPSVSGGDGPLSDDGRNALIGMVQSDLDHRRALQEEARRRARMQVAQSSSSASAATTSTEEAQNETSAAPADAPSQTHPDPRNRYASWLLRQTPEGRHAFLDWMIDNFEGGYVNDPRDPGGPTKYGITQRAIDDYKNLVDGSFNLAPHQITRDQAVQIYDELIKKRRLDRIADPDIRAQVIDMMVNPGIEGAGQILLDVLEQRGYDVRLDPTDNVIGSRTLGIIRDLVDSGNGAELARINNALVRRRQQYYEDRIRDNPAKQVFRDNWMNRAANFRFLPTGRQR